MRKTAVVHHEIETSKNQEARRVAKMKAKKAKKKAEFEQMRARMGVSEGKEKQKSLLEQLQFRQHLCAMKKKPAILGAKKRHFKPQRESATKDKHQPKDKSKKKFNFEHMRASKCADIRHFITLPGTKEAKLSAKELRKNCMQTPLNSLNPWFGKAQFRQT